MPGLLRKIYSLPGFYAAFLLVALAGAGGVLQSSDNAFPAIAAAADPLLKTGVLLLVVGAALALAAAVFRLDQKVTDDFVFQTLLRSAYLAGLTLLFSVVLWHLLLAPGLGDLPPPALIGLWMLAWALGWLWVRLRGTSATR